MPELDALLITAARDLQDARDFLAEHPWDVPEKLQQAAEKMVKAVIVREGKAAPRIHDFNRLVDECLGDDHEWTAEFRALDRLRPWVVAFRYPGAGGDLEEPPDEADLTGTIDELTRLLRQVARWCLGEVDIEERLAQWRTRVLTGRGPA